MKISKARLQEIIKEEYNALSPLFEEDLEEDLIYEEDLEEELEEEDLYEYVYQEADDDRYGHDALDVGPVNEEDFLGEADLYAEEAGMHGENPCREMLLEIMKLVEDVPENDRLFDYLDELLEQESREEYY
tara:strand:+ start:10645 stop:11037 length:393 start_codon:yes stop_codon:yes gene_type:complete